MAVSAAVDSLYIVATVVCGVLCLVLVLLFRTQCPFCFCNHLDEEERAGCFTLIVFPLSCDCVRLLYFLIILIYFFAYFVNELKV